MKPEDVTVEQFAMWSFERDKSEGLYGKYRTYESLPCDEVAGYLTEASYYMKGAKSDWPNDILERLQS